MFQNKRNKIFYFKGIYVHGFQKYRGSGYVRDDQGGQGSKFQEKRDS